MPNVHPACSPECPHPRSEEIDQIEFVRKPMTDWLAPGQLARTGLKAAIAGTFGAYADKRELQAALLEHEEPDDAYAFRDGELWFDFVADLGDGFDATYSIARLLAADLTLEFEGTAHETKRGQFLLLGGDQVYPTAARDEYQNRFLGPYRAALPYVSPDPPAIYALPGNHDWYDGLTSFLRIFTQRKLSGDTRWIGAWRTRQRRSYFALRLPDDWWIWAVDSQLESDLDHPQLLYFEQLVAAIPPEARARQKIILITAEPNWVNCPHREAPKTCRRLTEAFNTLAHFEKTYIRRNGMQLKLALSGDLHHYVRYDSEETATIRITSGGGGAFLFGTEEMPEKLEVREGTHETVAAEEPLRVYRKQTAFPNTAESRELADDIWWLPFRNRMFGALLGSVYVLFGWLLQTSSGGGATYTTHSLIAHLQRPGVRGDFLAFVDAFILSPLGTALALIVVAWAYAFTAAQSKGFRRTASWLAIGHGVAHVVLCCALLAWISVALHRIDARLGPDNIWFIFILIAALFLAGWGLGGWLFATYLWVTKKLTGVHAGELFSSMAIEDYKNFLRFRLDANGTLTVFVIGLLKVAHDWKFVAPGDEGHGVPWFHSRTFGSDKDHSPHVIERFEIR